MSPSEATTCHILELPSVNSAKFPCVTLHDILLKIESACMLMRLGSLESVFCKEFEYVLRFFMQASELGLLYEVTCM
jgi:hypothetical protein